MLCKTDSYSATTCAHWVPFDEYCAIRHPYFQTPFGTTPTIAEKHLCARTDHSTEPQYDGRLIETTNLFMNQRINERPASETSAFHKNEPFYLLRKWSRKTKKKRAHRRERKTGHWWSPTTKERIHSMWNECEAVAMCPRILDDHRTRNMSISLSK